MPELKLVESIALQICDGDDPAWQAVNLAGDSDLIDNLHVLHRLTQTLRGQDESPDVPESWGSLKIVSHLGSGASADVFRAHDPALQRDVALKLFRNRDPESQRRLLEEGRMLARVNHPNVVRVFGAEEHDGRIGLWMELIEGQTLEDWMQANGLMSAAEAATVGRELCAALAAVHGAGLIYRDIKLQNVIRQEGGEIRLTDFGSGMRADSHVPGRISGTPFYLAPELFDDVPASARSDIYALGVLLYRLTTGSFPVEADSIDELQEAVRLGHRELLDERPDLPASFNAAIEKAISVDPDQRFVSPGEFATALGELRNRPVKSLRRRIGIFAMLGLAIVTLFSWPTEYQLDTSLYRIDADGIRTGLETGATVTVGDDLVLELTSTVPIYVYVFNEDAVGNAWGLFPLESLAHRNPLAPGVAHALPGMGNRDLAWTVDSAGIVERIHIFASPEPEARIETRFADLPPAQLASGFDTRGVGSVTDRPQRPAVSAAAIVQLSRDLAGTAETTSGASYRVIELTNPELE
jgi:tRNA A-37 threonylcarbamoyl transferase component Bud32